MVGYCNRNGVVAIRLTSERPVSGQSVEGTFVASLCTVCLIPFLWLRVRLHGAKNDTTQQSGQTPDKELEIKNLTVCVSGYTETDTTGMISPPTVWRQQSLFRADSLVRYLLHCAWDSSVFAM